MPKESKRRKFKFTGFFFGETDLHSSTLNIYEKAKSCGRHRGPSSGKVDKLSSRGAHLP